MMNKTKVVSLFILYFIILAGCVENKKEEVIDTTKENNEQILEYAYGSGIKDYNGETITYDSEYLEIPFVYFNEGNALQVGLLVFINGIPQIYSVDDLEFENYHIFDIGEKKTKEITLKIKPNIGKTGDNLNLNFVSVLNPNPVKSLTEYRFNHSLNQPMGTNLEYLIDSTSSYIETQNVAVKESISKEDMKRYKDESTKPVSNLLDNNVVVEAYQDDTLKNDVLKRDENTKVKVAGYSGDYILYKVYDGINVDPNGIYVSAKKETYDVVDIGELPDDIKNIYFMIVPVDIVHYVEQSQRLMVK